MRYLTAIFVLMSANIAHSHEMTPTYPVLEPSYVDGVYRTKMSIFNKRIDTQYYEIEVFDKDFKPIPFASSSKIIELEYLDRKSFEVYIRTIDTKKAKYICTKSKLTNEDKNTSLISSRICSKIK